MPLPPLTRRAMLSCLAGLGLAPRGALTDTDDGPAAPIVTAQDGKLLVRRDDLVQMDGRLVVQVNVPQTDKPVLGIDPGDGTRRRLEQLVATGQAAGNHGDLYENRDGGHSRLSASAHPQLTHVDYAEDLRNTGHNYGPAGPILFAAPLIGNSSTALRATASQGHVPMWRSLPRLLLTSGDGPARLYQNYLAAQMHVYPGHRDHDPELGDLIPAATPFFYASQGSSGSDRAHLQALAMALAALRPDTKEFLRRSRLMAATMQMIYRRSLAPVRSTEAYRSGLAHGSVVRSGDLNPLRMINLANALTPETVPPLVGMRVDSESDATEGLTYFGSGFTERLLDTPVAIARVWRSFRPNRSMTVSVDAAGTEQAAPARFHWHVLRGDPERIRIERLNDRGTQARISLAWQEPRPVPGRRSLMSSRIDIGVFAEAGPHDGMPALISILLPHHETRSYGTGPDGQVRIESRDFRLAPGAYADPALFPVTDWRDNYSYDAEGKLTGWVRENGSETQRFDAQGRLLTDAGPVRMHYEIEHLSGGVPVLRPRPATN